MKIETSQFTGTESYYRIRIWGISLTDGAKYVADQAGAYWLMDEIGAKLYERRAQKDPSKLADGFFVVKLAVNEDKSATLTFDDGNDRVIGKAKSIPFTDYPDPELKLYVQYAGDPVGWVVMVPSEY